MSHRNRFLRRVAAIASLSLVAGCGLLSDGDPDDQGPIVVGTTSAPSTLDPAGAWDGSWELYRNIFQTLLAYPNGATTPSPTPPGPVPSPTPRAARTAASCAPAWSSPTATR